MDAQKSIEERFDFLKNAFLKDNFNVKNLKEDERLKNCQYVTPQGFINFQGKIGILAEHITAKNTVTGQPKRAFYLEGNNYQMGFQMGLIAEPDVSTMATDYIEKVVFYFFNAEKLANNLIGHLIGKVIVDIMEKATSLMEKDIPQVYKDEMAGIYEGCRAINADTKVTVDRLRVLNVGVDCLLAHVYSGKIKIEEVTIPPFVLKVPHMCNAFSVCGDNVVDNNHYFGRNFMFPTADIWQDTACVVIYNPDSPGGQKVLPIVSQTAPGMVGAPVAMNFKGAAIGVDMNPTMFCNPERPGLNSLLLNRDCMDHCPTTQDVVDYMVDAPRGVSWLYPVADGQTDLACIVEAGYNIEDEPFPYYTFVKPDWFVQNLPDETFILNMREKYRTPAPRKGLIPRWSDYQYPEEYLHFNRQLWDLYNQKFLPQLQAQAQDFINQLINKFHFLKNSIQSLAQDILKGFNNVQFYHFYERRNGFINNIYVDKNCPGPYYFAPKRNADPNLTVVSNHNISPEMRLTAMNEWITFLAGSDNNDVQWRYDILNYQLLNALENGQKICKDNAWRIINNLSPDPSYPFFTYYNRGLLDEWQKCQVHGSVTLCELKGKTFTSLFGYYGDEPVTITLPRYIN